MGSDNDGNIDYTSLLHMVFIAMSVLILIVQFIFFSVNTDILERQIHSLMGRITNLEAVLEDGQDDAEDDAEDDVQEDADATAETPIDMVKED